MLPGITGAAIDQFVGAVCRKVETKDPELISTEGGPAGVPDAGCGPDAVAVAADPEAGEGPAGAEQAARPAVPNPAAANCSSRRRVRADSSIP